MGPFGPGTKLLLAPVEGCDEPITFWEGSEKELHKERTQQAKEAAAAARRREREAAGHVRVRRPRGAPRAQHPQQPKRDPRPRAPRARPARPVLAIADDAPQVEEDPKPEDCNNVDDYDSDWSGICPTSPATSDDDRAVNLTVEQDMSLAELLRSQQVPPESARAVIPEFNAEELEELFGLDGSHDFITS